MALKKSPKKSDIAKTPQCIDTDEEVVDFTGLRSRGTPLRSPPKPIRTAHIVAPSGGGDDHRGIGVSSVSTQGVLVRHCCLLRLFICDPWSC